MLDYNPKLKQPARRLRGDMTDAEQRLWSRLRRKQIGGVQFYRQKPIGSFIVDFYGPAAGLVIEIDGSQHLEEGQRQKDRRRDALLNELGLQVLRFDDRQVLLELDAVMEVIFRAVMRRARANPP
jgi:very-short-patch-repair endonuclease